MSTMEATTYVNFVCQRCALPLKLAPNIAEIEEKSFQELTAIANGDDGPPNPDVSLDEALAAAIQTNNVFMPFSQSPAHELVSRRVIGPKKMQDRPPLSRSQTTADSFVVLAQQMERSSLSQNKKDSLSYRIKVANRLFDILSGNSPNDHPLCNECSEQLLEELEARIEEATQERDDYVRFLQEHEREVADDSGKSEAEYEAELQELTREEETLQAQIAEVEAQRAAVAGEAKKVTAELAELDVLEQKYWRELNTFQRQSLEFQKERDSLIVRHAHAHTQLERLKRTNVYNDTFQYGTMAILGQSTTSDWAACLLLMLSGLRSTRRGGRLRSYCTPSQRRLVCSLKGSVYCRLEASRRCFVWRTRHYWNCMAQAD
eukprot:Colp12_sorted_trinity150504_noHs@22232